jgi:hypothetical protein
LLHLIYHTDHFLTEQVVDGRLDMGALRHLVADRRGRVERIRSGGAQRE